MGKSEKLGKRPGERYSTLYREISIMRICNFNASPNPAKLPKRKPAASTLRANPEHRGSSLVHSPLSLSLPPSRPGFSLRSLLLPFTPALSPLSSPSRNPITPRATSYVQQPNSHTRTRRTSPPSRSNRFRPCVVPRTFVSPIFSQLSNVVSPLSYRPLILRGGLIPIE